MTVPLLSPDQEWFVDAVARRVVELLDERAQQPAEASQPVDAATLARMLGVSKSTVYEHAAEFGAVELPGGKRSMVRFNPQVALESWTRRDASSGTTSERSQTSELPAAAAATRPPRRRRGPAAPSAGGLLPIKGNEAA